MYQTDKKGYGLRRFWLKEAAKRQIFENEKTSNYSLSPGVWQSFVTIRSCNHLMRIISTYVDNTKKSEIS